MCRKKSHHPQKGGENAGDEPEKVSSPAKRAENAEDNDKALVENTLEGIPDMAETGFHAMGEAS